jgi:starch-binding outer membrane protein, SusD/RagB family
MKKICIGIIYLAVLLAFSACDSNLDKINPNYQTPDNFYKNAGELTRAVNGTYAVLQDQTLVSREWFFVHDLRGDDWAAGGGQLETPRLQLLIGTNDPANAVANNAWNGYFALIHRANVVIEKGPDVTMSDETLRKRLIGEAKFLRAWAYFELVYLWGGVPLYTEYVKDINGAKARSSVADVYTSIISNLTDAIASLPSSYTGGDIGRATEGAARMLLARVYMQQGNYADAKTQLRAITGADPSKSPLGYKLVDNYNDNFLEETEYNAESVFEVGFMDSNGAFSWGYNDGDDIGSETTVHNQEISPVTWGNVIPSQKLLEDFESTDVVSNTKTDPRYKYSFYEVGDTIAAGVLKVSDFNIASSVVRGGAPKKVGWRKHTIIYKNSASYYPSGINERMMRYAEVVLMLAECQNETGESETDVLNTLNQIRDRKSVSMPHYPTAKYPTATKDDRFRAIVHEKRVELSGEEIRNRDILRWRQQGKLTLIGGDPISYFTANKFELLPIPQGTIDNNPNIGQKNQNPGY